jgi:hypothetical protein
MVQFNTRQSNILGIRYYVVYLYGKLNLSIAKHCLVFTIEFGCLLKSTYTYYMHLV